jgi:uncharacterized protein (DUF2141 family)
MGLRRCSESAASQRDSGVFALALVISLFAPPFVEPIGHNGGPSAAADLSAEALGVGTCAVRVVDIDPPWGLLHASLLRDDRDDSLSSFFRNKVLRVFNPELAFTLDSIPYGSYTLRLAHDSTVTSRDAPDGIAVSRADGTPSHASRTAARSATALEATFVLEDSLHAIQVSMKHAFARLATLTIEMVGFRNQKGVAQVTLFNSAEGFPDKPDRAFLHGSSPIVDGESQITFLQVPFGTYGVGVVHDENSNEKMDTNFLGKPREGYGASNDARGRFGPPSFEDARFSVDKDTVTIAIAITY